MTLMIKTKFLIFLMIAWTPLVMMPGANAQENPSGIDSTVDPDPNAILQEACNFLKAQKAFTVEKDITFDNVLDSGEKVQYSAYEKLAVRKPNQMRAIYTGDRRDSVLYYNGKTITLLNPAKNLYATKPAPPTIDETVNAIEEKYGIDLPLSNLIVSNPCIAVTPEAANAGKTLFIGLDMVNRVPAYHLLFHGQDKDWQLWVSQDAPPRILKVVIAYKDLPGVPQYSVVLSKWNFNPSLAADTFTFKPPAGAAQIDFLPSAKVSKVTKP